MATMTVAQALASTQTGIVIADTPANIASIVNNTALLARVASVTLNGDAASGAADATKVASLGAKFSVGTNKLTVRGTVADLTNPIYTAGLTIATHTGLIDTAANLIAAAGLPVVTGAGGVVMSQSAEVTLAGLIVLGAMPAFSVYPGAIITLADTAANLLAITPTQKRAALKVYKVAVDSTVTVAEAQQLTALSGFVVANGVTLTVAGTVSAMTDSATAAILPSLAVLTGIQVSVSDALDALLANATAVNTLAASVPGLVSTMTDTQTIGASTLSSIAALPNFEVASGHILTINDTLAALTALSPSQASVAQATTLSVAATADVQDLHTLLVLPGFTKSQDNPLAVIDTRAQIATLTTAERDAASTVTIADTLANVLAGSALPSGLTSVNLLLDANPHTVAEAAALLAKIPSGVALMLVATQGASAFNIQDTLLHLTAAGTTLEALADSGPVSILPTDANGTFTAAEAAQLLAIAGFDPSDYALSIADTGSALSVFAQQIFGRGFGAITVTSGQFSGTAAQLLDPSLHFAAAGQGSSTDPATARLSSDATVNSAQVVAMSALPSFSLAAGMALTVSDTAANLVEEADAIGSAATDIIVTAAGLLSVEDATVLAELRQQVGSDHFTLVPTSIVVEDLASAIGDPTYAVALALATTVRLADDSIVSVGEAETLIALGAKLDLNDFTISILDTAANLATLAQEGNAVDAVNGWGGMVILSTDATLSIAAVDALMVFEGLTPGRRVVTISDTVENIVTSANSPVLHAGQPVTLSADATVSAADLITLATIPDLSPADRVLLLVDTPAHLATLTPNLVAETTALAIATKTGGNTAEFTISAADLQALAALPNLFAQGLASTITVSDTALALVGAAQFLSGLSSNALDGHLSFLLSADAEIDASTASVLALSPEFGLNGHVLTIIDDAAALLSAGAAAGIAVATHVELSHTEALSAADATALMALHGYTDSEHSLIVTDTPAKLLGLGAPVLQHSILQVVVPETDENTADYTLSVEQVTTLAGLPRLSFVDFDGEIDIVDTAGALADLATAMAAASPGSELLLIAAASEMSLSADAVVDVSTLGALRTLPRFAAGGQELTLEDVPAALLGLPLNGADLADAVLLADNATPWVMSAADAAHLAAFAGFDAGSAGVTVSDSAANILAAPNAAGVAMANSVVLNADAVVSAAAAASLTALGNFDAGIHSLTIRDTAGAIAALAPDVLAEATSVEVLGASGIPVSQFVELRDLDGLAVDPGSLTIADTAANLLTIAGTDLSLVGGIIMTAAAAVSGAQAETLSTLPNFNPAGGPLTIVDTAANLLALTAQSDPEAWDGLLIADAVTLSADAVISVAQAQQLTELGVRFGNGGHALVVEDTPDALLSADWAGIAGQVTGFRLQAGEHPWTISAANASELVALANFDDGPGMMVVDSVGNLLAPENGAGLAAAVSVAPGADITLTVAQAEGLHAIPDFTLDGHAMVVSDGGGRLATLDADVAALATSIRLAGASLVNVTQLAALRALPGFSTDGKALIVSDTAANLLTLSAGDVSLASMVVLNDDAILDAAQADALASLPHFSTGVADLAILDTAANLLHVSTGNTLPDNWEGELVATSVALTQDATITAAQAAELALLGGRFSLGGHMLTISDTPEAILDAPNAVGLPLATLVTLSGSEVTVSAAMAARLVGLDAFAKGDAVVTVSDTAANLASAGYAAGIAMADHVELSVAAVLSVSNAKELIGTADFRVNDAAPLTIQDTIGNLLTLGSTTLASNDDILRTTPIMLSADAVATAAQVNALRALPQYALSGASFDLNGFDLILQDTGLRLAGFTPDGVFTPTGYEMAGDATLTASQANTLAARNVDLGDNDLTVADTPANLLDSGNAAGLAIATSIALSADATVTAAQAASLAAEALFSTGGHHLTVEDTAEDLLGLSESAAGIATSLQLAASQDVSAATLTLLLMAGTDFHLNGHTLVVVDTATQLAALSEPALALSAAQVLGGDAVVTAALATHLAALSAFDADGHALIVRDTAAALLSEAYYDGTALADAVEVAAPVTLTVSGAAALIGIANFQPNVSAPVTIADTFANLLTLGSMILAHNDAVLDATPIGLSGDAVASVAQLSALAILPQYSLSGHEFRLNGHALTLADSGENLAAFTPDGIAAPTGYVMVGDAVLTAAEAAVLADREVDLGSYSLILADDPVALLDADHAEARAFATSIGLDADVTVSAATATALFALSGFTTGGFELVVEDSSSALLDLSAGIKISATQLALSGSEIVDAASLQDLAAIGITFDLNGHTLTVVDTA
ncbi:MAG: beta strand repeat-containing protein, partial [Acetobacteraceae bacterium]